MNQIEHIMELAKEYRDAIIEDGVKRQALRAAIEQSLAVQPKQEPVMRWCETCSGTGRVYQEHQAGCWVGGKHDCPDCEGHGYTLTQPQPEPQSNIDFLYEQLRKETDGGSESMTHEDAIDAIRIWRDAYYAQKYPQPEQEPKMHSITADPHKANKAFLGSLDSGNFEKETGISVYRLGTQQVPQPQPKQEPTEYDHGPQAATLAEAERDVRKWLNERPNRPLDLRHVAMLAYHAQQWLEEPQPYPDHFPDAGKMIEPFGYFRSTLDGWEDCAETDEGARPLYEAPQPKQMPQRRVTYVCPVCAASLERQE